MKKPTKQRKPRKKRDSRALWEASKIKKAANYKVTQTKHNNYRKYFAYIILGLLAIWIIAAITTLFL